MNKEIYMTLSSEQITRLNNKWQSPKCPNCAQKMSLRNIIVSPPALSPQQEPLIGIGIKVIPLVCTNCGHIEFIDYNILFK